MRSALCQPSSSHTTSRIQCSRQAVPLARSIVCCSSGSAESHTQQPKVLGGLAAGVAASLLQLSVAGSVLAAPPAYNDLPGFGPGSPFGQMVNALDRQSQPNIDDLYDENLMTRELKDFVNSVMDNKMKPEEYPAARLKMNFRRDLDGRVAVRSREGQWYRVRLDMEVGSCNALLPCPCSA